MTHDGPAGNGACAACAAGARPAQPAALISKSRFRQLLVPRAGSRGDPHLQYVRGVATEWDVAVGEHLSRPERMRRFGGAKYGGIEPSGSSPNVFVYSDPSRGATYGYNFDGWSKDKTVFLYTGEGRIGPQLMREGNRAIAEHKSADRALRVFVADGVIAGTASKDHLYLGEFSVDDVLPFTTETAPDEAGDLRTVFVFRLRPVGPAAARDDDESATGDVTLTPMAELVAVETDTVHEFESPGSQPATATKRESQLAARYQAKLEAAGSDVRRWRIRPPGEIAALLTDLYDNTVGELYEAKAAATRPHIRLALGQLLDYRRHLPTPPAKLTVLVPSPPSEDLTALLHEHGVGVVWELATAGTFGRSDP